MLGHTRWASVGIISEANAHPLNHEELDGTDRPYVVGALNGDVDNYADLKALEGLQVPAEITTDAKVIPTLVARRIEAGAGVEDAFRATVSELAGSMGIAAQTAAAPDKLLLSLRGSGQALYVGLVEDSYVIASEPYGVVEETSTYLRMDGETPADPERASATRGQVVALDAARAGTLAGIERSAFDGTPLPVHDDDLQHAEITTRDIDRGDFPHFLLKEISEAPASFRKTLRGKVVERDGRLTVALGNDTLPESLRARLRDGSIRRVTVIGQGTAAIAGQSLAATLTSLADDHLRSEAVVATEFSGFQLRDDMSDTLVVAISQSGTTTDTNRTSDLARSRGAAVVAIVNRRNSDLTDKADGVLYTSDGRDVEMAVPSTKAFYAQIAAGYLLAIAIADEVGAGSARSSHADVVHGILDALRALPDAMTQVLTLQAAIGGIAQRHAVSRRYWAVVGNGRNRIAAAEVRVKASELCYKSISFDSTEDKKHIDLSAEPLVLVCAAGLQGSNADDVAKEIAIYRAHRAAPIVITTEGERRFDVALETIAVPVVHPDVAFVLSAMAGHLFGYEAALAIDSSAHPLREARAAVAAVVSGAAIGRRAPRSPRACDRGPCGHVPRRRARRFVRRPPRSRHRGAHRIAAALRDRHAAARRVPGRARRRRHAEPRRGRPHCRAHRRHRGADPTCRRDQAPGQDGHRRHLALRRGAPPGDPGPRGARSRCGPRRAQLPRPAHARRARPRGRAGHGLHALPDRG